MNASSSDQTIFYVKSREVVGKKVSSLRNEGLLPANIYGLGKDSESVSADQQGFFNLYEAEGDTGLIYLVVDEKKTKIPVLIDEVAYHPITSKPLHVAFKRVDLKEKITAEVPVELIGENEVPGAAVISVRDSLEVRALPEELPEKFEVDISTLKEFGDAFIISDLDIDTSKVEIVMLGDMDAEAPLVLLQEIKEEEEEEVEVSVDDVEVIGEKEAEEETEEAGEATEKKEPEETE